MRRLREWARIDYIAGLGDDFGSAFAGQFPQFTGRRLAVKTGMAAAGAYERELVTHLIDVIQRQAGTTIAGITDPARFGDRVPTVVFTMEGHSPQEIAEASGKSFDLCVGWQLLRGRDYGAVRAK